MIRQPPASWYFSQPPFFCAVIVSLAAKVMIKSTVLLVAVIWDSTAIPPARRGIGYGVDFEGVKSEQVGNPELVFLHQFACGFFIQRFIVLNT